MRGIDADEVPCGLIELDADERIVDANAVFRDWVGPVEIAGRRLIDFIDSADPDLQLDTGEIVFLMHQDGSRRAVLVERARTRRMAVVFDATRRQDAEDRMLQTQALVRRTQNRLQLVIDASIAFAAAQTATELATLLASTAASAYAAEESIVYLVDDDGRLTPAAGTYPFGDLAEGELVGRPELARGQVLTVSGLEEALALAAPLGRAFASAGVHSVIAAPILHEGVLLGVFACFFLHPRAFDEQAAPLAEALAGQAGQVITSLQLQRRLEHAAMHDETTGLPNRRSIEDRLRNPDGEPGGMVAILFVDLDGFKQINDRLGHAIGDRVLAEVGRRLRQNVRDDDVVARYGGDEFVVLADVADEEAARQLAERIRSCVEEPLGDIVLDLGVTASIGLSLADSALPIATDQLIRLADQAMYDAKSAGGNRVSTVTALEPPAA